MMNTLLPALIGGIGIGIMTGIPGCFVLWHRLAYFGETIAHASLLGVAISFALHLPPDYGLIGISVVIASLLIMLKNIPGLSSDSLLGLLSHSTLATGSLAFIFLNEDDTEHHEEEFATESTAHSHEMIDLLFGNILNITTNDLILIFTVAIVLLIGFIYLWKALLLTTISPDIARAEGFQPQKCEFILAIMVALVVSVSIQIVGLLLVTALLIMPAATARQIAKSPEIMAIISCFIGACATATGLLASLALHIPAGPTIVVVMLCLFITFFIYRLIQNRLHN